MKSKEFYTKVKQLEEQQRIEYTKVATKKLKYIINKEMKKCLKNHSFFFKIPLGKYNWFTKYLYVDDREDIAMNIIKDIDSGIYVKDCTGYGPQYPTTVIVTICD